ncbi:MAG: hypothetical protein U0821_19255 [Chloroflexota bacterium]
MYCTEAPVPLLEDVGRSTLVNSRAYVRHDPDFASVIGSGYDVFLTAYGQTTGLAVVARDVGGFEVCEAAGGTSSYEFAYRVVGRRADVSGERFKRVELASAPAGLPPLPEFAEVPPAEPPYHGGADQASKATVRHAASQTTGSGVLLSMVGFGLGLLVAVGAMVGLWAAAPALATELGQQVQELRQALTGKDGVQRQVYFLATADGWIEDAGRANLVGGTATVPLDADFASMISAEEYLVFVTAQGGSGALTVTNVGPAAFTVREAGGSSSSGFSYRILAKRRDHTAERLPKLTAPPAQRADPASAPAPLPVPSVPVIEPIKALPTAQ